MPRGSFSFSSLLVPFRGHALLFGRVTLGFLGLAGAALKILALPVAGHLPAATLVLPATLAFFRWRIWVHIAPLAAHFHSLAPFLLPPIVSWLLILSTSFLSAPFLLLLLISTAGACVWHFALHNLIPPRLRGHFASKASRKSWLLGFPILSAGRHSFSPSSLPWAPSGCTEAWFLGYRPKGVRCSSACCKAAAAIPGAVEWLTA